MEDALSKKRFLWGLLLAWAPWVPTLIAIGYVIGINNSKATGLAAVVWGHSRAVGLVGNRNHDHLPSHGDCMAVALVLWCPHSAQSDSGHFHLCQRIDAFPGIRILVLGASP